MTDFLSTYAAFAAAPTDPTTGAAIISLLEEQESSLVFSSMDSAAAQSLGQTILSVSPQSLNPDSPTAKPIVVAVYIGTNLLYYSAQDGTATDNFEWIQRKALTVLRFGHSSLLMGIKAESAGVTFNQRFAIPITEAVGAGGGFPLFVKGVKYPVGMIGVSGLPHMEDHDVLVRGISKYLSEL
ncbi:uncharacterized protein V2V93DRAFT_383017 [Kockiozyma suomiensis]|uniref:uncharacterized protein n=1 Tax=Kockiozyma suomiensis TaxID=1337062 RepID=UPI0033438E9E